MDKQTYKNSFTIGPKLIPVAAGVLAIMSIAYWQFASVSYSVTDGGTVKRRVPGKEIFIPAEEVDIKGEFASSGEEMGTPLPGNWPNFRGPDYNAVSPEDVHLSRTWPANGPKRLWEIECGIGYAGAAVKNGRVYLLDYDEKAQADTLRCLSLADGKELWRRWYYVEIPPQHGISRTIPAVTDEFVVTLGPKCHVLCCDAKTGKYLWSIDLVREYQTSIPQWYAGQCPIIIDGKAIIAPGGKSLMIAVDCKTGKILWDVPNPKKWKMTHTSILPMKLNGKQIFIYCASGGVAGISADDGEILFLYPGWTVRMANVPTPVLVGKDELFLSGGYGAGSMMLKLTIGEGGKIIPVEKYRLKQREFGSEQQTPIFFNGSIYGVLTRDAGLMKERMVCMDIDGKRLWASPRKDLFGPYGGPFIIADGLIIAMNDDCELSLIEASPDGYRRIAKTKLFPHGKEAWAPMAIAGGLLLARDITKLVCLDLRKN